MRDRIVAANSSYFAGGGEELNAIFMHARSKDVHAIQPRTFTTCGRGGGEVPLLDRQGNLVLIECQGLVNYAAIVRLGVDIWLECFMAFTELTILLIDELSRRRGSLMLMCRVMDMSEYKVVKFSKSKAEAE